MAKPKTDLAVPEQTEDDQALATKRQELVDQPTYQEWADAAKSMLAEPATSESIVHTIINADTIDDILGGEVIGLESIVGQPFTIERAELQKSDFADGLAAYIVIHARFDDGTSAIITSGATNVVAQTVRMVQKGFLPYRVSSKRSGPTANGYYVYSLCKPDQAKSQQSLPGVDQESSF